MKQLNIDRTLDSLSQWVASGTVVEDVWLFLRRPYLHVLRRVGWKKIACVHRAQKKIDAEAPTLGPKWTMPERLSQGPWPWVLCLAPLALTLALHEAGIWFAWIAPDGSSATADQLGDILRTAALILGILYTLLLLTAVVATHTLLVPLHERTFFLRAFIRNRGFIPVSAVALGSVLTSLLGYCFRNTMARIDLANYCYLAVIFALTALILLVVFLIRTFQSLSSVNPDAVLSRELTNGLRASISETLFHALVAEEIATASTNSSLQPLNPPAATVQWNHLQQLIRTTILQKNGTGQHSACQTLEDTIADYLALPCKLREHLNETSRLAANGFIPPHPTSLGLISLLDDARGIHYQEGVSVLMQCICTLTGKAWQYENGILFHDYAFQLFQVYHRILECPYTRELDIRNDIIGRTTTLSQLVTCTPEESSKSAEFQTECSEILLAMILRIMVTADQADDDKMLEAMLSLLPTLKAVSAAGVDIVYVTFAAWLAHHTQEGDSDIKRSAPLIEKCLANMGEFQKLVKLHDYPGLTGSGQDGHLSTELTDFDRTDATFLNRRRDCFRFLLLHKAQELPPFYSSILFNNGLKEFLADTAENDYLVYALFENTSCGLSEEELQTAKANIRQLLKS